MRDKLISYVDSLFSRAPNTQQARDIHDEILLNTLDRFDEELACGSSEQQAFDAAVASIGNLDEVLDALCPSKTATAIRRTVAISLYVLCVMPVIIGDYFGNHGSTIGVCLMFFLAAFATYLLLSAGATAKERGKQLRALGIGLYILCVTPPIFFDDFLGNRLGELLGVCLMFLTAAAATALVLYPSLSRKKAANAPMLSAAAPKQPEAPAPEASAAPAQTQRKTGLGIFWKIFVPVYWVTICGIFTLLGLFVLPWFFSWPIFPIAGALFGLIEGFALLLHEQPAAKKIASSLLWLLITLAYFLLTVRTRAFFVTWLCFPIGAALNGVLSGVMELIWKGEKTQ